MPRYDRPGDPLLAAFFSNQSVDDNVQLSFVAELWPQSTPPSNIASNGIKTYFSSIQYERSPNLAQKHTIQTFRDIILIVSMLRANMSLPFNQIPALVEEVLEAEPSNETSPKTIESIELAVRLWLMLNIRNQEPRTQYYASIPWKNEVSLEAVIKNYTTREPLRVHGTFSQHMNLHEMKKIAGFRYEWVSDMGSHLMMRGSTIRVFHHVSILKWMKNSLEFPLANEFINETLETISLLIPLSEPACNKWLNDQIFSEKLDESIRARQLPNYSKEDYKYWIESLLEVSRTFEEFRPRTLLQWFYDTRDMERWWGFWLIIVGVVLTVVFGLIQSVTGILQVMKPG